MCSSSLSSQALFQQKTPDEAFDIRFILTIWMCLERQVQVLVRQVETVLKRQQAAYVDPVAFAVEMGITESHNTYGKGTDFVVTYLPFEPLTPDPALLLQPLLSVGQCCAGRDRIVPATEACAWIGVGQDGVVTLTRVGLFYRLLPGQFVGIRLRQVIGHIRAHEDQVAGPRGYTPCLGTRRARRDALSVAAVALFGKVKGYLKVRLDVLRYAKRAAAGLILVPETHFVTTGNGIVQKLKAALSARLRIKLQGQRLQRSTGGIEDGHVNIGSDWRH